MKEGKNGMDSTVLILFTHSTGFCDIYTIFDGDLLNSALLI